MANEEKQKEGLSLPQLAATVGIGYVGFKNRDKLINGVSSLLQKGTAKLSRTASSTRYKGFISEAKNLSNAVFESYGEPNPINLVKGVISNQDRSEMINKRTKAYNQSLASKLARDVPEDVSSSFRELKQSMNRNKRSAREEASLVNMRNIVTENERYQKAFGDKTEDVLSILQDNKKLLLKDPLTGLSKTDGKLNEFNLSFMKMVEEYNGNPKKRIDLGIDPEDQKTKSSFVSEMMNLVSETHQRTTRQVNNVRSAMSNKQLGSIESGNVYHQFKQLYDIASFEALRKKHSLDDADGFTKMMLKNGNQPVTMKDATQKYVEEIDGRMYVRDNAGENKQFKRIDDLYSVPTINAKGANTLGVSNVKQNSFANEYIKRGQDFGVSRNSLENDLFSSSLTIDPKTNELIDTTALKKVIESTADTFQPNFQIPGLQMNPLDLTQRRTRKAMKEAPNNWLFKTGDSLHFLDQSKLNVSDSLDSRNAGAKAKLANQSYLYTDKKIIDTQLAKELDGLSGPEAYKVYQEKMSQYVLEDKITLINQSTGVHRDYSETLSGFTNKELDEQPGKIKRILGLGQEEESIWGRVKRAVTKFDDPFYAENVTSTIMNGTLSNSEQTEKAMRSVYGNLFGRTTNFSPNTQEAVYGAINDVLNKDINPLHEIDLFEMGTEEGTLKIANLIAASHGRKMKSGGRGTDTQSKIVSSIAEDISQMVNGRYASSPESFLDGERYLKSRNLVDPRMFADFAEGRTKGIKPAEDLKMLIEEYGIALADEKNVNLTEAIFSTPNISKRKAQDEVGKLRALGESSYFSKNTYTDSPMEMVKNRMEWADFYQGDETRRQNLDYALRKTEPWYGAGMERDDESRLLGWQKYAPIKEHQTMLGSINEAIKSAPAYDGPFADNEQIAQAASVAKGVVNYGKNTASSLVAGPNGNITTATALPWFFANRLDRPLRDLGLGLPNELKGSAASIVMNQWGRRIVLPFMAYETAKYIDGLTGDAFSDTAADTYVNMHQDVAAVKEFTGLNNIGRTFDRLAPWNEQIEALPFVKAFNFATLGLFSDNRSGEEVQEYYESGEDPIRSGRFWGLGSNSPWMGNKIDRYEPNWYRKMKSDYMFSENVYGSEEEYWENHWMPTLGNPLAPVRHFITDPYHYENKHAESRPYAITGGFNELQQVPLIGPAVNSVVSGVLKPQRVNPRLGKAHEEYLANYNERLSMAYINMNAGGAVNMSPGGGITLNSDSFNVNFVDEEGEIDEEALIADEMSFNAERDRMAISLMNDTGVIPSLPGGTIRGGNVVGGVGSAGAMPPEQLAALEVAYGEGNVAPTGVTGNGRGGASSMSQYLLAQMNARLTDAKTINRSDQVSNAGTIESPNVLTDLNQAVNQQSLFGKQGVLRDIKYSAGEFAGMYGFLSKTAFGFEEGGRGTTLESSSRFNSYNDMFWDRDLGGLGGDLSEIGRRYLPRDPNKDYYNPIRNTMPGWLPGADYFTDFLHGDPYSKVKGGEMRLPGDSYEKLYNVRKDAMGNYSAFDRYRILADVAPYSDQYRAAKKEVSLLNQNGYLDEDQLEEYRTIRKQVSSKTKKRNWYEERFQNAQVIEETVTVEKVLDQNTFLTKEYGNNPIKLAGVNVKSDNEMLKEVVGQFIKPGETLKIAINADAKNRVRDDMMNTIRAVVYTPHAQKGSLFGLQGLGAGANLNYYLAKQATEFGGDQDMSIKDDGTAVSTHALYSENQITTGKMMENFVHNILPNVPVANLFADKFLPVKSAVEDYEDTLYSKSWRDWTSPINDWVKPMLESTAHRNPLFSFLNGYGIGALATARKHPWRGGLAGGLIFGGLSGVRTLIEAGRRITPGESELWIPERRQSEREIDEYFDKIKYVKYKGLYNKAKEAALEYEGTDLDAMFQEQELRGVENKNLQAYLKHKKKWLNIEKKSGSANEDYIDQQLADIKEQLSEIDGDRPSSTIGPYAALALRYKDEFESTLYGAEDNFDYNKIYRALPSKDKQYFTAFQKASPEERQQILKLVPKNQRRIYQGQFGLEMDKKESLDSYFAEYNLPDENWEGWDASTSLDNIKIKVMRNEGLELTEANYWPEDEAKADKSGVEDIPIKQNFLSSMINTGELEKVLRGAGLEDVRIQMNVSGADSNQFSTSINIQQDRTKEIEVGMKEYMNTM